MKIELSRYANRHGWRNKLYRASWCLAWLLLARWTPRWCLAGWRCQLLRLFGAKIGKGCRIVGSATIWAPKNLSIGDNSWIDEKVKLYSVDKIEVGSNCVVSEDAFLCTATHDINSSTFNLVTRPIRMGDCSWVASRAVVLPGVSIGEGAVVGCASVVAKDVHAWDVVVGAPARFVKRRGIE